MAPEVKAFSLSGAKMFMGHGKVIEEAIGAESGRYGGMSTARVAAFPCKETPPSYGYPGYSQPLGRFSHPPAHLLPGTRLAFLHERALRCTG